MSERTLARPRPTHAANTPKVRANRPKKRLWLYTAIVGVIALVINVPLLNAILVSFKPDGEIAKNPLALPTAPRQTPRRQSTPRRAASARCPPLAEATNRPTPAPAVG